MHNDQIPWKRIIISGHALDPKGEKISKTAKNFKSLDHYLGQYGQNGLRFWAAQSQAGSDTRIDEPTMHQGKKLANKLRNAKRFIEMQTSAGIRAEYMNSWWLERDAFDARMDRGDWADALKHLTRFFWGTFCDKWIEDSKTAPCNITLNDIMLEMEPRFRIFLTEA